MDKRTTFGLLITLAVLIAVAWYLDRPVTTATPAPGSVTPTITSIWSITEANITEIQIKDTKTSATVDLQKGQDGNWVVVGLPSQVADQNAVTSALTQIATLTPLDDYGENLSPADFGLDANNYLITVSTSDGKTYQLEVGRNLSPSGDGYYARLRSTKRIFLISQYTLGPVIGFLTNPPLPATPTPTATATSAVSVTPTATGTPAVSGTPGEGITPTESQTTITPIATAATETPTP